MTTVIAAAAAHAKFRSYPTATLATLVGDRPVLIVAPHPDDESIGCGGLIALAAAAGRPCSVAILTDGAASHPGSPTWPPARLAAERERETLAALAILGHPPGRLDFHRFPDTRLPSGGPEFDRAVAAVLGQAVRHDCRVLVAPWIADPHGDHLAAATIAAAAAAHGRLSLLSYPVWGWTLPEAAPVPPVPTGGRLDIAAVRHLKLAAIAAHRSQHGGLVDDAESAFSLPQDLLDACGGDWETYIGTVP